MGVGVATGPEVGSDAEPPQEATTKMTVPRTAKVMQCRLFLTIGGLYQIMGGSGFLSGVQY